MSKRPRFYVSWPNGQPIPGTVNSALGGAISEAVAAFLPDPLVRHLALDRTDQIAEYYIWAAMRRAGFKINEVISFEGVSR